MTALIHNGGGEEVKRMWALLDQGDGTIDVPTRIRERLRAFYVDVERLSAKDGQLTLSVVANGHGYEPATIGSLMRTACADEIAGRPI